MSKKSKSKTTQSLAKTLLVVLILCLWVVACVVAVQFILGYIMLLILGADTLNQPVWLAIYSVLSYVLSGALIILVPTKVWTKKGLGKRAKKKSFDSPDDLLDMDATRSGLGLTDLPTWTDIGLSPVGFIVAMMLASGLILLFSNFSWFDANQTQYIGFGLYMSSFERVVAYLALAVFAPFAEEVIFRGWLYGMLREKLSSLPEWAGIIISIIITSIMFGLVHMQWNVGVIVFALSVVACAMREITGTIYAGILTHIIWNTIAFFQLYVFIA